MSEKTSLSPENVDGKVREVPKKYEGYVSKRRKWPLKGWHKRYFVLDRGFLKYSKSPSDIAKGKLHGIMDVGLCVMSTKKKSCRIDLDAEETIFHIKIKSSEIFKQWVLHIRAHREYRNSEFKNDTTLKPDDQFLMSPTSQTINDLKHFNEQSNMTIYDVTNDLLQAKRDIDTMRKLLLDIQSSPATTPTGKHPSTNLSKKERKMSKKMSKKNAKSSTAMSVTSIAVAESAMPTAKIAIPASHGDSLTMLSDRVSMSKSNPDLLTINRDALPRGSLPGNQSSQSVQSTPTHSTIPAPSFLLDDDTNNNFHMLPYNNQQTLFIEYAGRVCQNLEISVQNIEKQNSNSKPQQPEMMYKLLNQLHSENRELKNKLQRIHAESTISGTTSISPANTLNLKLKQQFTAESQLSISEGMSECFYDAEEYLLSDEESSTDGEESDAQSTDSQLSELDDSNSIRSMSTDPNEASQKNITGRRKALPCFKPEGGDFSLWNILKKNIGKDLSKVSMPVAMNEPLNALQLLCEGMEYSELLDQAVICDDPYERMVLVAAFAVSSYGPTNTRAGQKPFNPLLGETYECIREDKGFKFIAEQVSHHPPISACHCKADAYEFYQDARWKNKFWGKSMEVLPMGLLHLNIPRHGDHYTWNKVTTCIHNIMSGTRWVEHYGEMKITNGDITCKIMFSKSGYWSNKKGEFSGNVTDSDGEVRQHIHGKWFEGFYSGYGNKSRCVWRPAPIPQDCEKYYGFSQFAIELNELDPLEVDVLPRTDTRFRPDQRHLEEGNLDGAEQRKQQLEQMQRERRKQREENGVEYQPMFFKKLTSASGEEIWMTKNNYWNLRNNPGFAELKNLPKLW